MALTRQTPRAAFRGAVVGAVADAVAVFAPSDCVGCGREHRGLCSRCATLFAAAQPHCTERLGVSAWCGLDYEGAARRALIAFKDGGRTEAARALSVPLTRAVAAALAAVPGHAHGAGIELATIPSDRAAFRRRGFRPVELLLAAGGLRGSRVLRHTAAHLDQVGLDRDARARNLEGALQACAPITANAVLLRALKLSPAGRLPLHGRRFLVVDDILTSGATVAEAVRALRDGGAEVCGVAALADTRLRLTADS